MGKALTGIHLEDGTHKIEMKYTPPGLWPGSIITIVCALLFLLSQSWAKRHPGWFVYRKQQTKEKETEKMLKDLVKKNRSYRGYDETYRFTKETLMDFVDHARLAPSSVNAQPFRYYLAWEKEETDRIQALTKWARALPQMELPHKGMCPTAFIVICQDTRLGESLQR